MLIPSNGPSVDSLTPEDLREEVLQLRRERDFLQKTLDDDERRRSLDARFEAVHGDLNVLFRRQRKLEIDGMVTSLTIAALCWLIHERL